MDKSIGLNKKKEIQYDILKEFARYCNANKFQYFLAYGTLLGAIRHSGYIPWDDDIDVMMPYPDFIKFIDEYKSDNYYVSHCSKDLSSWIPYCRLYDLRTYRKVGKRKDYGCCIDIYCMFGAPSTREQQCHHIEKVISYKKSARFLYRVREFLSKRNLWPFSTLAFKPMNRAGLKMFKELSKYSFKDSDFVWVYSGESDSTKEIMKKSILDSFEMVNFEDSKFKAPIEYEYVLTTIYGNWRQLPPEQDRHPYHATNYYWK